MAIWHLTDNTCSAPTWFDAIVRAETEQEARALLSRRPLEQGGDLGRHPSVPAVWTDPARSTCVRLEAEGAPEVLVVIEP